MKPQYRLPPSRLTASVLCSLLAFAGVAHAEYIELGYQVRETMLQCSVILAAGMVASAIILRILK